MAFNLRLGKAVQGAMTLAGPWDLNGREGL